MQGVFGELSLSVRQQAWLHAIPRAPDKRRKPKEGSRLWKLQEQGREPKLPEVACSYLLDCFFEVGPAQSGGMGQAPLSFQEIDAWSRLTGRSVSPFEALTLRRMSMAWVAESARAEDPDASPPWAGEQVTVEERVRVADSLQAALEGRK